MIHENLFPVSLKLDLKGEQKRACPGLKFDELYATVACSTDWANATWKSVFLHVSSEWNNIWFPMCIPFVPVSESTSLPLCRTYVNTLTYSVTTMLIAIRTVVFKWFGQRCIFLISQNVHRISSSAFKSKCREPLRNPNTIVQAVVPHWLKHLWFTKKWHLAFMRWDCEVSKRSPIRTLFWKVLKIDRN